MGLPSDITKLSELSLVTKYAIQTGVISADALKIETNQLPLIMYAFLLEKTNNPYLINEYTGDNDPLYVLDNGDLKIINQTY